LPAFELGERTWKLGFTTGPGQQPRIRQIPARSTSLQLYRLTLEGRKQLDSEAKNFEQIVRAVQLVMRTA